MDTPLNDDQFIVANLDSSAYIRINYDKENLQAIINQLKSDSNSLNTRMKGQFVNDILALSQANYINASYTIELLDYLKEEVDFLPIRMFLNNINHHIDLLDTTEVNGKLKAKLAEAIKLIYDSYPAVNSLLHRLK